MFQEKMEAPAQAQKVTAPFLHLFVLPVSWIMTNNLQSTDFNSNLFQKHPHRPTHECLQAIWPSLSPAVGTPF
jgi:hypothetical protein